MKWLPLNHHSSKVIAVPAEGPTTLDGPLDHELLDENLNFEASQQGVVEDWRRRRMDEEDLFSSIISDVRKTQ